MNSERLVTEILNSISESLFSKEDSEYTQEQVRSAIAAAKNHLYTHYSVALQSIEDNVDTVINAVMVNAALRAFTRGYMLGIAVRLQQELQEKLNEG